MALNGRLELLEGGVLFDERIVAAEEDVIGTGDFGHDPVHARVVEIAAGGGVEPRVSKRLPRARHESEEGQAAAPVGADDLDARVSGDEGGEVVEAQTGLAG